MRIEIAPETERLLREEIQNGSYGSVDELIQAGLQALRERKSTVGSESATADNLVELFRNSPFRGLNIEFERDRDYVRKMPF